MCACAGMCKTSYRNGTWGTGIRRPRRPHHSALVSAMRMRSLVYVGCVNAARSTGIGRRNAALYHFAAMAMYIPGWVCRWQSMVLHAYAVGSLHTEISAAIPDSIRSIKAAYVLIYRTKERGRRKGRAGFKMRKRQHFSYTFHAASETKK